MTLAQVLQQGWQAPAITTTSTDHAKVCYKIDHSVARFVALTDLFTVRRSKIRAAHRRYLRKIGMPLAPLPKASKYRTKGRRVA